MTQVLKLTFDLCFYYSVSGFYLYLIADSYPAFAGFALLVASICLYVFLTTKMPGLYKRREKAIKILCALLPASFLLFTPSLAQIVQFLPALAYLIYSIWKELLHTSRYAFIDHLSFTAKLMCIILPGFLVGSKSISALQGASVYMLLYLFAGVAMLRILREDGKIGKRKTLLSLGLLAAFGICLVAFNAPGALFNAAGFIYQNIIANILFYLAAGIGYLIYGIIWLVMKLLSFFGVEGEAIQIDVGGSGAEIFGEGIAEGPAINSQLIETIAYVVVILLIAFIIFMVFRRLLGAAKAGKADASPYLEENEIIAPARTISKTFRPRDRRLAVRWYYQRFLIEGIKRGGQVLPRDTSETVEKGYRPLFAGQSTADIRHAYIKARYQEGTPVSAEDVASMAAQWKKLKKAAKP